MMIRQCYLCGNCAKGYALTASGAICPACQHEVAEFDADELGLDPETDNDPNHQERAA